MFFVIIIHDLCEISAKSRPIDKDILYVMFVNHNNKCRWSIIDGRCTWHVFDHLLCEFNAHGLEEKIGYIFSYSICTLDNTRGQQN